jgi:hypothetical protein
MMPPIPPGAPDVPTAKGPLRPERAILYNNPFLLLWHFDPVRSGHDLDEAVLAGLKKTAHRLNQLLRADGAIHLQPMAWPQPEVVLFRHANAGSQRLCKTMAAKLIQNEAIWYVEPLDAIEYRRC